ncbi:MAG: aminoacyl-tRNA hydrolase [Alphaproteobacteria bacterium]|nr:aminoacyl-tRNA hydrolase [Alphaproteobacteria bacterium]MBV9695270.1 aminoacyl-tRNA hydrolase [Alphaproteobacteria bacterium]
MLRVTPTIAIDESEIEERFIASAGPGGQNVNKVATTVQLRFDVAHSPSLPDPVRLRLIALSGARLTRDGVLILTAREFRTQERNRAAARARLLALIREAAIIPKARKRTKPTRASKERRIEHKKLRARLKKFRGRPADD